MNIFVYILFIRFKNKFRKLIFNFINLKFYNIIKTSNNRIKKIVVYNWIGKKLIFNNLLKLALILIKFRCQKKIYKKNRK